MDRSHDLKKTKFVIREVILGEYSLDKLQCGRLSLEIKDSEPPSLTLTFSINNTSTLVDGNDDIEVLAEKIDQFDELVLTDEYAISELYKIFKANFGWSKYPRLLRFVSQRIDKSFIVKFKSNGKSHLRITRVGSQVRYE